MDCRHHSGGPVRAAPSLADGMLPDRDVRHTKEKAARGYRSDFGEVRHRATPGSAAARPVAVGLIRS